MCAFVSEEAVGQKLRRGKDDLISTGNLIDCTEESRNHREDSLAWLGFLDTIQLLSFHLAESIS